MSEIKNPFLDDNLNRNDNVNTSSEGQHNNTYNPTFQGEEVVLPKNNLPNSNVTEGISDNTSPMSATPETATGDDGVIEIKKDSNLLRNIIITLIIMLILAILGLTLWSFLGKNKPNSTNDNNSAQKEKITIETPGFEMTGNDFKASSVVIEE